MLSHSALCLFQNFEMFNSTYLGVDTPQKTILPTQVHKDIMACPDRFAPSKEVKKSLEQIVRVHKYLYHAPLVSMSLEEMNLSHVSGDKIVEFLLDQSIPDSIMRMEELLIAEGVLNKTIRDYISEEFDCDKTLSFPLLCVFMYIQTHKLTYTDALEELFCLPLTDTVCKECVDVSKDKDKAKCLDYHNFKVLQDYRFNPNELLDISDDSVKDPDYSIKRDVFNISCDSSSKKSSQVCETVSNPFLSPVKSLSLSNPFLSPSITPPKSTDHEEQEIASESIRSRDWANSSLVFDPQINSTALVRLNSPSSFKKRPSQSPLIPCDHCSKQFSNRYNMKMHLIRKVHEHGFYVSFISCH